MKTTVINIWDCPPGWETNTSYVYCGRPGRGHSGTYGNKHPVGYCKHCNATHGRGNAVGIHAKETILAFATNPVFRLEIEKLRGKYLVCFCSPKACHCDVYAKLLGD